ncbi:hypothetical protein PVAP13_8KG060000 [Panicum virgatum]|uniref:E3 ubiquitin-protein ligase Sina-like RING finger domain-containing protein n=1 Tax=Panicum virgatum TaxID=38727 RepID=A0A8T0PIC9_PANVG|nr:hypothetical protein PVAP13_8KG060000 [Panicum virgatum]
MAPASSAHVRPASTAAAVSDLTLADRDFLECSICFLPLKPPIFQCAVGHVLCSPCRDKLKDAGRCHLCGVALAGGYRRCHAMERVVDSDPPAYHALEEHLRECIHAPCHCPPGSDACGFVGSTAALLDHSTRRSACGFVGSTAALLDHVAGSAHRWPHVAQPSPPGRSAASGTSSSVVWLRDGFNFVVSHGRTHVFLLNVVHHPFCSAISVICIRPRAAAAAAAAAAKEIKCELEYYLQQRDESGLLVTYTRTTEFQVACSDPSDGLPDPNESYQLIVPKYVYREEVHMPVDVRFAIE